MQWPAAAGSCLDSVPAVQCRSSALPRMRRLLMRPCGMPPMCMQAAQEFVLEQKVEMASLQGEADAAVAACERYKEELDSSRQHMVTVDAEKCGWLQELLRDKDLLRMIDEDPKRRAFFMDQIRWAPLGGWGAAECWRKLQAPAVHASRCMHLPLLVPGEAHRVQWEARAVRHCCPVFTCSRDIYKDVCVGCTTPMPHAGA